MRALQIKVIARPIEVGRQQKDTVVAILATISLTLNKKHLLGKAIGSVCLLWIPIPQFIFMKRDWRVLGVRTDGTNSYELTDMGFPGRVEELHTHHQVVIKVLRWMGSVRSDSPYPCGQMDDCVGL